MRRSISSYNIIKQKYERIGLWKRRGKSSCARSAQKSRIRERFTATARSSSPRSFIWGRPCCPWWNGISITRISPSICCWILPIGAAPGCSYIACLRRSPALFHTASTLSAPSGHLPHAGKASSVAISFSAYTCIHSDYIGLWLPCLHSVQTKTALRGRALQSGFWFYYSTVTDFARFLGLSTSFPLLIEV